jgi:hypothetical protein
MNMKKTICAIALGFLLAHSAMAAPNPEGSGISQESISLGSSFYADMDLLYRVAEKGTASNARPWTKAEAQMILSRIERKALPLVAAQLYDSLQERLKTSLRFDFKGEAGFGVALEANAEAYWHTNTAFDTEPDWVYGFEERKPMVKISLDFSIKDFFYSYCDIQYGRNRFNYQDEYANFTEDYPSGIGAIVPPNSPGVISTHSAIYSQPFLTNFLEHSYDFDFEWPKRAVTTIGGSNWNFSLARDRIQWGNGNSGNLILDDHVDYHEYARITAFSDVFKYDWVNVFFQTNPTQNEEPDNEFRVFMAHRLEFRILERITFAISENVMYRNDVFDLRYLNPSYIYHNLNNRSMFNAIAHAELDITVAKGFTLYGQFAMDQARAPNESTTQSDSNGFLAGLEYAGIAGPGILSSSLEFAYTSPLFYRRDGVDFLMYRKYFTHGNPAGPAYVLSLDYIGYPYGSDAQVVQWDIGYRIPSFGTFGFRLFGMRHGEMDFFTSHNIGQDNNGPANYEGSTPSGDNINEMIVATLFSEVAIPSFAPWIDSKFWMQMDWIGERIYTKSTNGYSGQRADLQLTMGISLTL